MPNRYAGVLVFLPFLVADAWCTVIFQTVSVVLFHYRKKAILSWFGAGGLLGSAILVYLLSMSVGPVGAAIGLLLAHFGMLAVVLPIASGLVFSSPGQTTRPNLAVSRGTEYVVE